MITIHERRIIIASEKKFNKKKAIIVAVIIAVTLTTCAGCNRLSPTELEEVVSDINSNASATTETQPADMTAEGSETDGFTPETTTETTETTAEATTPATVPAEATTPKPSDTTTTKPSETETDTTTTTTTTAATPQSTETSAPATTTPKPAQTTPKPTTTTTTAPKPTTTTTTAPKPAFQPFIVYTKIKNVFGYSDEDLTDFCGGYPYIGSDVLIVEENKEKGVYKTEEGYYVKSSDFTYTDTLPAAYHYPFDFEAIKQDIIAQNDELGLKYFEDTHPDAGSWFVPTVVDKYTYPAKLYEDMHSVLATTKALDEQMTGFTVRIKPVPYEEYGVYGYPWGCYTREEWEELDVTAIYIVRG